MLITSRDRVQKLKSAGKSAQEAVAEKPFADLDPVWGKGIINSSSGSKSSTDALSLRLSIFLTSNLSNQFAEEEQQSD